MKPIYWVVSGAAVVAAVLYFKNKNKSTATPATKDPSAATGVIPMPKAEESKIINLPDSLLQNTSGNTGIIPPVILNQSLPVKVAQPTPITVKRATRMKRQELNGNAFILN